MKKEPSRQRIAVMERVQNVGPAKCDICRELRADCNSYRVWLFITTTVCDTCWAEGLKMFRRDVGGGE